MSVISKLLRDAGHDVSAAAEKTLRTIEQDPEALAGPLGIAFAGARNLARGRTLTGGRKGGRVQRPAFNKTHQIRDLLMAAESAGQPVAGAQPFSIPSKVVVNAGTTYAAASAGSQGSLVADFWLQTNTPDLQSNYTFAWPFISKRLRMFVQAQPVDVSANDADTLFIEGLHVIFSVATEFARTSLDSLGARRTYASPLAGATAASYLSSVEPQDGVEWDVYYEKNSTYKMQVFTAVAIGGGGTSKTMGFGNVLDGWVIQDANLLEMNTAVITEQISNLLG